MNGVRTEPQKAAFVRGDTTLPLIDGTVGDRLRDAATRVPDRPALLWREGDTLLTLTYRDLWEESRLIAWWLLTHATPGDRVAIWSRNTIEWVLLEYGCALAGTIIAAWNPAWTDTECARARSLTEPRLVFAGKDTRGMDLFDRSLAAGDDVHRLDALREVTAESHERMLPTLAPDATFLLQFTSGTTGSPKAAAQSHRSALNAAWLRARLYGADEADVWLNPVPLNHIGGAIMIVLGAMVTGGAYILMKRFDAGEYVRLMQDSGATRIGGVPTMLLAALDHPDWRPVTGVRSIGMGGAQVPPSLIARLQAELGAPVLTTYGQSESPFVTSSLPSDDPLRALETTGRVAPYMELKICDPASGTLLDIGQVGEIVVRGPGTMSGYYAMPDATAATLDHDGFLRTGDLGSLDSDGYLRLQGRARDVVIRGGENIYPVEVEDVLFRHPAVALACVVGVPDARWGQQVGAAIVLRPGATTTPAELEAHAAGQLAHFKVPRQWRFTSDLPMTASSKVRKVAVERMFDEPVTGSGTAR